MKKLKDIKSLLSRDEMRQIQGGSYSCQLNGPYSLPSGCACNNNSQCIMGVCKGTFYSWIGTCA